MIYIGTSGYSFRDWVGPFYPAGIPQARMLDYYATQFPAVEVNSTYYRQPHPRTMEAMARKTGPRFRFTVKFHADITHRQSRDPSAFDAHERGIAPFVHAAKFAGSLAQFPWSFRNTAENRDYLCFLREVSGDRPVFVEFRHDSWVDEQVFDLLEKTRLGFCSVDEPRLRGLFPSLARAAGDTGYVRLHGRNAEQWWTGTRSTRYDYLYSERELEEWAGKIRELESQTRETYVFFNNCHGGQAALNAGRMRGLLGLELPARTGDLELFPPG